MSRFSPISSLFLLQVLMFLEEPHKSRFSHNRIKASIVYCEKVLSDRILLKEGSQYYEGISLKLRRLFKM